MKKKKTRISSATAGQIGKMRRLGHVRSNWAKSNAMTKTQVEAAIASDPDEAGLVVDWTTTTVDLPRPKGVLNMRVDRDVLDFFRAQGRGYQTRINAVLRSYVDQAARGRRRADG